MKAFVFALVMIAVCFAEEEKKTEKRGVLGLGYGGFGYGGVPVGGYPGYGLPLGYGHGVGLPYQSAVSYHGFTAPTVHAPAIISKAVAPIAPIAPVSYAAPLHAPLFSKTIASVPQFGYSSPYLGYNHGLPFYH